MDRPTYRFKIGQHVFCHAKARPHGGRAGPFTVVGLERQSDGVTMYRIKS